MLPVVSVCASVQRVLCEQEIRQTVAKKHLFRLLGCLRDLCFSIKGIPSWRAEGISPPATIHFADQRESKRTASVNGRPTFQSTRRSKLKATTLFQDFRLKTELAMQATAALAPWQLSQGHSQCRLELAELEDRVLLSVVPVAVILDSAVAGALDAGTIDTAVNHLVDTPLANNDTFTQDDISNNRLVYSHDGSETVSDSFTFTVSDGVGGAIGSTAFSITVTPVNDNVPVVTPGQSFSVAENALNGASVGFVVASDPDTGTVFQDWTLTAGNTDGIFAINAATGEISVADNTNLDYETTASYSLTLTVSDDVNTSISQSVVVNVDDVDEFDVGAIGDLDGAAESVPENSSLGTTVGITALAEDADGTDTVAYSLDNDAGGRFAIDPDTGVVTVAGALDYESAASHLITVRAAPPRTAWSGRGNSRPCLRWVRPDRPARNSLPRGPPPLGTRLPCRRATPARGTTRP